MQVVLYNDGHYLKAVLSEKQRALASVSLFVYLQCLKSSALLLEISETAIFIKVFCCSFRVI